MRLLLAFFASYALVGLLVAVLATLGWAMSAACLVTALVAYADRSLQ